MPDRRRIFIWKPVQLFTGDAAAEAQEQVEEGPEPVPGDDPASNPLRLLRGDDPVSAEDARRHRKPDRGIAW
jgi:hypothetical protein